MGEGGVLTLPVSPTRGERGEVVLICSFLEEA
jgi:hypothetical protein